MELQRLQDQLSAIQSERERVAQQGLDTSILDATIRDVQQQIAEVQSQQHLEERVEQAKETGYILDTIEINGLPSISFSHTPANHELLAIAVQKLFLSQEDAFNSRYDDLVDRLKKKSDYVNEIEVELEEKREENYKQNETINQLTFEKNDTYSKLANAMDIIAEKDAEIKRLSDQQNNAQAVPVAPLSAEEQESKLVADLMGNRLKVTHIRFKDESGLDRRKVLANNALTGDEIEEYAIYSKTRWEEISFEEAAQLQADYAIKKAEIDAQNAVIPTIEQDIESVTEQEAPAEETPFQEETGHELGERLPVDGEHVGNETPEKTEEDQVITLESLKAEVDTLKSRLTEIESHIPSAA